VSEGPDPRGPGWRRTDAISGAVFLALALAVVAGSRSLEFGRLSQPGPGFFPLVLALLLAVLSAALLIRGLRRPGADVSSLWPDRAGAGRVLVVAGALFAYVALVDVAGYLLTTAALFLVLIRVGGGQSWAAAAVASAAGSASSYLLFARALRVALPAGLWLP
jgi:putative tricarboxylic transport membrane protein